MELQNRLEILNSSGLINDGTKEVMLNVLSMFKNEYVITLTEDNGAMMVTHLSMAIMRVKNNEPVKEINEEVYIETLESEHFNKAEEIYSSLEKVLDVVLPESEKKYMLVNICVILESL